jgi:beta-phosphoglucomutase-like phosphatase (HAD superfamily)
VTEARAVLFDLDGTLIGRRQVYLACHRLAAAEVLGIELADDRVLELIATGALIRTDIGGFECETRGARGDFSSIMRGALALASNDAPARSRTLEDGCVDLAGHLPLPHAPPLAGRAKDRKLALSGAHARAYGHVGAVDGVRPDPSPPAPARAMVTADATKRTPRVERPRNRAYTVSWELERKSPRLTTRPAV